MNLPDLTPLPDVLRAYPIDTVVNTHLHWDHCSGNMHEGKAAFPNAQYVTGATEYAYAHQRNSRDAVSYIDANYDPLIATGQMRLANAPEEIVPGVIVEPAPGHNAGLLIVKAQSEGETFCMLSDLVPTAQHLKPTWIAGFDLDPLTAICTKERILTEAAESNWWCGFGHDMQHAFVTVTPTFAIKDIHS